MFQEFKYPIEYRRLEMLESFDDQLVAIKSLHGRLTQMLNAYFDVEPQLVKVSHKDEMKRCRLLGFAFLRLFSSASCLTGSCLTI